MNIGIVSVIVYENVNETNLTSVSCSDNTMNIDELISLRESLLNNDTRYIMGIDPGFVPLTYCIYDTVSETVVKWDFFVIDDRSINTMDYTVAEFVRTHRPEINLCSRIFIEIQMRPAFKCFAVVLRAYLGSDNVEFVSPARVKNILGITVPKSNHALNKKVAVWYIEKYFPSEYRNMMVDYNRMNRLLKSKNHNTKDIPHDLADALLLCLAYWIPIKNQRVFLHSMLK
jgi:hypothetical protein